MRHEKSVYKSHRVQTDASQSIYLQERSHLKNICWPDSKVVNRVLLEEHIYAFLWNLRKKYKLSINVIIQATLKTVITLAGSLAQD
jgi:hypothetical protein